MDVEGLHVRRATIDDYEAVMDIDRNLLYGLDYLPTLYHYFCQSKRHVAYVAETDDNKIVAYINYRFDADGKTVSGLSGRIHKDYRQRGIAYFIAYHVHNEYPTLTHMIYGGLLEPVSQEKLDMSKKLSVWNFRIASVSNANLQKWKSATVVPFSAKPLNLSYSESVAFVMSGFCENFLRNFTTDFTMGHDCLWSPVRLCAYELKELLAGTNTLVTPAADEQGERQSDDGRQQGSNSSTTGSHGWNREIRAMSYSSSLLLKTNYAKGDVKAEIFFYGDRLDDFVDHCRLHLFHLASVCGTSDLHAFISFPLAVDDSAAEKEIATTLGMTMHQSRGGQGYLACGNYDRLVR